MCVCVSARAREFVCFCALYVWLSAYAVDGAQVLSRSALYGDRFLHSPIRSLIPAAASLCRLVRRYAGTETLVGVS